MSKKGKKSVEYHKKLAESVYEWAKAGLPFFWDVCENLKDKSQWICVPPNDNKEIILLSKHIFTDGKETKVSVEDFFKEYKVIRPDYNFNITTVKDFEK
jgi:hypothetical protein